MKDLIPFFATYLHMSLLSKAEIQYLQGEKNASKYNVCKLKSIVSRQVFAFFQNEIPLVSQCQFMDLNTLMSQGKTEQSQ